MNPLGFYHDYVRKVATAKSFLSVYDMGIQCLPWLLAGWSFFLVGSLFAQRLHLFHQIMGYGALGVSLTGIAFVTWIVISEDWRRNMERHKEDNSNG